MVRFQNVGMRYGRDPEILRDISFHLEGGSYHFLSGPSGAGKSSLLKLMYLALRPSRGRITMFNHDFATMPRRELPNLRRRIGVVFQDFRLLDHLTAVDNVALPLRIAGAREEKIHEYVAELLAWVGLGHHLLGDLQAALGAEMAYASDDDAAFDAAFLPRFLDAGGNAFEVVAIAHAVLGGVVGR